MTLSVGMSLRRPVQGTPSLRRPVQGKGHSLSPSAVRLRRLRQEEVRLRTKGYEVVIDESGPVRLIATRQGVRTEFIVPEGYPFRPPLWRVGESGWFVPEDWSPAATIPDILDGKVSCVTIEADATERAKQQKEEQEAIVDRKESLSRTVQAVWDSSRAPIEQELAACKRTLQSCREALAACQNELRSSRREVAELKRAFAGDVSEAAAFQ